MEQPSPATAPAAQTPFAMPVPEVAGSGVEAVLVVEQVPVPAHEIASSSLVVETGDMQSKGSTLHGSLVDQGEKLLHGSLVDQGLAMHLATVDVEGDSSTSPVRAKAATCKAVHVVPQVHIF
ncbi:hypothetical protein ACOSQ3_021071 [Xanthoceras sorbifolium]